MIDNQILEILRCPHDSSKLTRAETELVNRINRAIGGRHIFNQGGHQVKKSIDGGLIREAGDLFYPIIDQIPVMLPDEAIDLSQLTNKG